MKAEPHTIVVGAGVIGVCCAYYLAKRGARVTVLERGEIGKRASFGNAGIVAPGHGPINRPGRIKQALKSMLDPASPLYIAPRWDPNLAKWLWQFTAACTSAHFERALRALAPLGHVTRTLFDRLVDEEKLDCAYRPEGYYEIFVTEAALDKARQEAALVRQHGYRPRTLAGPELREREPAINDSVVGGIFYPEAASLNPYRFVLEMVERARRHGATFRTGREVVEILTSNGQATGVHTRDGETLTADHVVLATGAYSLELARKLGCRLPLQAAKGYHRDRDPQTSGAPPLRITCMLGESSVFCTPMDGFVRFAGTLEFSGVNHEIRRPRLEQLTNASQRYLNGVGEAAALSEWCGLRACISDGLPVVGPVPGHRDIFIATGHAMLGLTLGPITGRLIAEYVLDGTPSMDIQALSADRF